MTNKNDTLTPAPQMMGAELSTDHFRDITKMISALTRPIVGIENRTAQEVFDIMSDRARSALIDPAAAPHSVDRPTRVQAAFEVFAGKEDTGPSATAVFRYIEILEKEVKDLRHDLAGAKHCAKNAASNVDYWRGQYEALTTPTPSPQLMGSPKASSEEKT